MNNIFRILTVICALLVLTTACAKKNIQDQSSLDQQAGSSEQTLSMQPAPQTSVQDQDLLEAQARQRAIEEQARLEQQARQVEIEKFVNENVYFDFDSASLREDAQAVLREKAEYLRNNPDLNNLIIEGHTDDRGTDAYNMALGARRADAVQQFMIDLGLSSNRFDTISYGEERPLDLGQNEEAWAKNRRASFTFNP
jgi:peptidoglycan-associated lipoprotein